jgi:nucleoside-diphosphate-sugar epimerase
LQWVLDAYLVTLTAFLLLGGALGDKYGRRRVFRIGIVGFCFGGGMVKLVYMNSPDLDAAVSYYGPVPLRELPVKEGTLGPPHSIATIAHRAVADLLALYRDRQAVEFTALALGHVYGTRQRASAGVVAAFAAARRAGLPADVHGTGKQTRDLVAVDDAVDAVVRATTRGTGLVINVGTGVQTSVNELHERVMAAPATGDVRAGPSVRRRALALSPVRARIHLARAVTDVATGGPSPPSWRRGAAGTVAS